MATAKKQVSFRLSDETIKELTSIAEQKNVSQAEVITILTHLYYTSSDIDNADEWFNIIRMS